MKLFRALRPVFLLLLIVGIYFRNQGQEETGFLGSSPEPPGRSIDAYDVIGEAFRAGRSDVLVIGEGRVEKVLRDDDKGSRHQRFLLALDSGQTVLIAHNIDLAPRIPELRRGDLVEFKGEYEWNERGGVVHWTHHDPAGQHADGWLRHDGSRYD
ncbi:MAG: DUF3465 domain-containing protein [Deltaproteobacteria bacterium]|nr:DUF3465 domain-containing protein [Deltaproteobacteria bacterium]MBW2397459.1 DUF3465 domain-containing protein [Deltaproteobacteria bacterium]